MKASISFHKSLLLNICFLASVSEFVLQCLLLTFWYRKLKTMKQGVLLLCIWLLSAKCRISWSQRDASFKNITEDSYREWYIWEISEQFMWTLNTTSLELDELLMIGRGMGEIKFVFSWKILKHLISPLPPLFLQSIHTAFRTLVVIVWQKSWSLCCEFVENKGIRWTTGWNQKISRVARHSQKWVNPH